MKKLLHGRNAVFAAVGLAAVGIAVGLIVASVVGSSDKKTTTESTLVPVETSSATTDTTVPLNGVAEMRKLLAGIPQHGNELGKPDAPVTLAEFADLQCPFCAEYAVNALPAIVREYVRSGKVKLAFNGMAFLGPDSEKALRTAYAAALQNHLWDTVDLLYKNQGPENSGWVSDGIIEAVAGSIPGVNVKAMLDARSSTTVGDALVRASAQAQQANVTSTPTFFAGPTGGTLQRIAVTELTPKPFRQALDALLK